MLSGFFSAGKTTLLNHVFTNRNGLRDAVIAKNMCEVNIDSQIVIQKAGLSRLNETLLERSNDCICCTVREDFLLEAGEGDERTIAARLLDQIEFADVLVLNKIDGLENEEAGEIEAVLQCLKPSARIVRAEFGEVPLHEVLSPGASTSRVSRKMRVRGSKRAVPTRPKRSNMALALSLM